MWWWTQRGLKVFGEGEWKVRQHGAGKRRTWLKVHLAVDAHAKEVIGVEVTTAAWTDGEVFGDLVDQIEGAIEQIDADGAYDTREAYDVAAQREAILVVPPRENAVAWDADHPRAQALAAIQEKGPGAVEERHSTLPTIAVSPKTPCTASNSSSGREWPHAFLTPS